MTFDQQVVVWCLVVPAVIAAGTFLLGIVADRYCIKSIRPQIGPVLVGFGWVGALCLCVVARQDWQIELTENWQYFLVPLFLWSLVASGTFRESDSSGKWMLVAVLSGVTGVVCLPRGEGWEDTYAEHGPVVVVLLLGMLINAWSLNGMDHRGAGRWLLLVALASLGGPLALAASAYGSLAECSVAMIAATTVLAMFGIFLKDAGVAALAPQISAAATCILAAGKFQTFEDHPTWLYLQILALPSIIAAADWLVGERSMWIRVAFAAILGTASVSLSAWLFLFQSTETW